MSLAPNPQQMQEGLQVKDCNFQWHYLISFHKTNRHIMQFVSDIKRKSIFNAILNKIPDVFIAILMTVLIAKGKYSFFFECFIYFIMIQIACFVVWGKHSAWQWIMYFMKYQTQNRKFIFHYLKDNNYPKPGDYYNAPEEYFAKITDDESLPTALRIKAAIELGYMNYSRFNGHIQEHMRLSMVTEQALAQFKQDYHSSN